MTTGAPQRWVTFSLAMRSNMVAARTCRKQTCTPPASTMDQGKHQPLQWNMGRVHR